MNSVGHIFNYTPHLPFLFFDEPAEEVVAQLYFKHHHSPTHVNNVLRKNDIPPVPSSNISDWAKARALHTPKKRRTHALAAPQNTQLSGRRTLASADRELLFIVEAIRARGAAVHLRELQALRAAQIMLSEPLASAVLRVRGVSTEKASLAQTSAFILRQAAEIGRRGGGAAPAGLAATAEREVALRRQQRRK